ncbi:MAG: type II toxin-antitoxin system Phd/YefM family antitoxin [Chlamydiae bacterium]|nr:type II toxin-antitoxin system Phd/YefM family antitoxin [Chlamydiota bacterium]MBI3266924.1 type II toxin-antitoxin system Phd/YefM family antitoxin [Chlamydiota bacterium]
MITMTATQFARNFRKVLDQLEFMGEEVMIVRNHHNVARIIPGSPHLTALEALADLYRTLPEDAAKNWLKESRIPHTLKEMRNPWAS